MNLLSIEIGNSKIKEKFDEYKLSTSFTTERGIFASATCSLASGPAVGIAFVPLYGILLSAIILSLGTALSVFAWSRSG